VVIGNGGAPLTGSKNYGFAVFSQRSDGAIEVDMIDANTGLTDPSFHFAAKPEGRLLPRDVSFFNEGFVHDRPNAAVRHIYFSWILAALSCSGGTEPA